VKREGGKAFPALAFHFFIDSVAFNHMPPQTLFDISGIDLNQIAFDQEEIRRCNPQRGHMEMLNAIVYANSESGRLIGYKDIAHDAFWVEGHIPGRPILPGVMMIEAGAQLASFFTRKFIKWDGFIGFGGVDDCKFRLSVEPGKRMYVIGQRIWHRHGRICCKIQGLVDGNIAFEATITGVKM
jgi:3-hydroxyacyl-[acyl-carrier-protein] dehydratase